MRKKNEEVRQRILEAARQAFLEKGYGEASIRDIAGAAAVSPATVYSYFSGKQELFDTLQLDDSYLDYSPTKERKRQEIVETALLMFGERGYDRTSLEAIMKRVNLGKTAIYQFFESKDELFAEVLRVSQVNLKARRLREMPQSPDWRAGTRELGRAYLEMGYDPLREAIFKTVVQQSAHQPEFGRLYHSKGKRRTTADFAAYLRPFQEQGHIRPEVDLELACFLFLSSLWGYNITYKYIKGNEMEFSDERVLDAAVSMFVDGIGAKP